jgi:SAM-dependent methyltransferase
MLRVLAVKYQNWLSSDRKLRKLFVSGDYYLRRRHFWNRVHGLSDKERFTAIYRHNLWNNEESLSGGGSTLKKTLSLRTELPKLFHQYGIKSILDAGCGDFHWMKEIALGVHYIGTDIVKDVVSANQIRFGRDDVVFLEIDITKDDLPRTDLVLCRQVLFHLRFTDVFAALRNFQRSGARYLLATHFPHAQLNSDIPMSGMCRAINFMRSPFNFPQPLTVLSEVDEQCLALWELDRLDSVERGH